MLAIKLNITIIDKYSINTGVQTVRRENKDFTKEKLFQDNDMHSVDKLLTFASDRDHFFFGAVITNTKSVECCHSEPKYEYECNDCESKPWLNANVNVNYD